MAWALRAGAVASFEASVGGSSWNPGSLGAAVSINDRVIIVIKIESHFTDTGFPITVSSVSDGLGNAYTRDGGPTTYGDASDKEDDEIWSAVVTNAGTPNFTITRSNAPGFNRVIVMCAAAFSGLDTTTGAAASVDISKFVGDTSGTVVSKYDSGTTAGTTGSANELKIGYGSDFGESSTLTAGTLDTTYTSAAKIDANGSAQLMLEYADSGSSGSTARATVNTSAFGSGDWWGAGVVVYKLPVAPSVFVPNNTYQRAILTQ
jgi:hypothetical protein